MVISQGEVWWADLPCITKLAESEASEHTLMAIAGHVSRKMIEHYLHIRMEATRPLFCGWCGTKLGTIVERRKTHRP